MRFNSERDAHDMYSVYTHVYQRAIYLHACVRVRVWVSTRPLLLVCLSQHERKNQTKVRALTSSVTRRTRWGWRPSAGEIGTSRASATFRGGPCDIRVTIKPNRNTGVRTHTMIPEIVQCV